MSFKIFFELSKRVMKKLSRNGKITLVKFRISARRGDPNKEYKKGKPACAGLTL